MDGNSRFTEDRLQANDLIGILMTAERQIADAMGSLDGLELDERTCREIRRAQRDARKLIGRLRTAVGVLK